MRLTLLLILLATLPSLTLAQISATTEDGRKVLLYEDGTWDYVERRKDTGTTYLQTDSKRMRAGVREGISDDIQLQVALDNGAPRLVMWTEDSGTCYRPKKFGEATLFLGGSATIDLVDRGKTGSQTTTRVEEERVLGVDGEVIKSENEKSYCQTWGVYHLTDSEVQKLKETALVRVGINWESDVREENEIISVSENRWTLRRQIKALGL